MKKFNLLLLVSAMTFFGCQKKEAILVTNENKRQVLTDYGKQNPEREVLIETEFGNISVRLYDETPLHRANFVKLIKDGYYEEPEFYRVVENFVVQGGVPMKKLDYTIPAEFNSKYYHKKGALAMARLDENNPGMESSSTEFYFVHGAKYSDSDIEEDQRNFGLILSPEQRKFYTTIGGEMSLDKKYTVFGEITDGLEVIDKIATVKVYSEHPYKKIPFKISIKN